MCRSWRAGKPRDCASSTWQAHRLCSPTTITAVVNRSNFDSSKPQLPGLRSCSGRDFSFKAPAKQRSLMTRFFLQTTQLARARAAGACKWQGTERFCRDYVPRSCYNVKLQYMYRSGNPVYECARVCAHVSTCMNVRLHMQWCVSTNMCISLCVLASPWSEDVLAEFHSRHFYSASIAATAFTAFWERR